MWPARHQTETRANAAHPPMGQLFRLKASFTIPDNYGTQAKAILQAMKTYGMYVADGGSDWYVSGRTEQRLGRHDVHPGSIGNW